MGFALQISPIASMCEDDEGALRRFLADKGVQFEDQFDPNNFQGEFFEVEEFVDGSEDSYVSHWEAGWSWWRATQDLLVDLLGPNQTPTASFIYAWNGVAVPADIDNSLIGEPVLREAPPVKRGMLESLGMRQPNRDELIARAIDRMVDENAGPYNNLVVVSGTRLLAELEAGIRAAGLEGADIVEIYEKTATDDPLAGGRCALVMFHKFLAAGMRHNHLVWWRK